MRGITILGIGNILLRDEGFGVRTVEQLQRGYTFPAGVQVLAGATGGLDLVSCLTGSSRLLLLDAVAGGGVPGQLYVFWLDAPEARFRTPVSLHELGIGEVLTLLRLLSKPVDEVLVIGMEPASLEWGLELTPPVQAGLPGAIDAVLAQLALWRSPALPNRRRQESVGYAPAFLRNELLTRQDT